MKTPSAALSAMSHSVRLLPSPSMTRTSRAARSSAHAVALRLALGLLLLVPCAQARAQSTYAAPGTISTLAGGAKRGTADGTGAAAQFDNPTGVAADSAGNVYVADTFNHTVRKISPGGVVTTLTGLAGVSGSADGNGSAARLYYPSGIAVDRAGNVYVTDEKHTIRRITPAGVVTTFAGAAGVSGSADGVAAAARFKNPNGLATDAAGNVFVTDTFNQTLRRIAPDGTVTTLAGAAGVVGASDGVGGAARFNFPHGLAVDGAGNVYVADSGNFTIRKVTPDGVVTTVAGSAGVSGSADGIGGAARFDDPSGIVVDGAGYLYVSDSYNQTLRRIAPDGTVTTVAGTVRSGGLVNGTGSAARFFAPLGLAMNPAGNLLIADSSNDAIRRGVIPATVPVVEPPLPPAPSELVSRISNVSVRAALAPAQTLIVGFTMQGGTKPVLLRAVGPGLGSFGVTGVMADPKAALYKGAAKLDENDNWGGGTALTAAFASVGGFPLGASSLDAALIRAVDGGHTAQITGPAGVVLVEAYDAGSGLTPRLINISARNRVGTGADILIAGFTVSGTGPKNLLIRAVGPTLGSFGVTGVLADPKLDVYSGGNKIAENDTWSAGLAGVFGSVGAFPLSAGSKDAALTVTLPPGGYTVQVAGADGGTGEALIEIYELP